MTDKSIDEIMSGINSDSKITAEYKNGEGSISLEGTDMGLCLLVGRIIEESGNSNLKDIMLEKGLLKEKDFDSDSIASRIKVFSYALNIIKSKYLRLLALDYSLRAVEGKSIEELEVLVKMFKTSIDDPNKFEDIMEQLKK